LGAGLPRAGCGERRSGDARGVESAGGGGTGPFPPAPTPPSVHAIASPVAAVAVAAVVCTHESDHDCAHAGARLTIIAGFVLGGRGGVRSG
jgi:hypothetical protein